MSTPRMSESMRELTLLHSQKFRRSYKIALCSALAHRASAAIPPINLFWSFTGRRLSVSNSVFAQLRKSVAILSEYLRCPFGTVSTTFVSMATTTSLPSFFLLSRAWLFLAAGQGCLATLAARRVHVRGLLAA